MLRGGHFGAMEEPEMMAGDILSFAGATSLAICQKSP